MKKLFDASIAKFGDTMENERLTLKNSYESILKDQKLVVQTFERKFSYTVSKRLEKLEAAVEHLSLEQGQILSTSYH